MTTVTCGSSCPRQQQDHLADVAAMTEERSDESARGAQNARHGARRVPAGDAHRPQGQDRLNQCGTYRYTYADLADMSAAPPRSSTPTACVHRGAPAHREGHLRARRCAPPRLGEEEEGSLPIFGRSAQEIGSSITYGRRYLLGCLTGIVTDDDEDGQVANRTTAPHPRRAQPGGAPDWPPRKPSGTRGRPSTRSGTPTPCVPTTSSDRPPVGRRHRRRPPELRKEPPDVSEHRSFGSRTGSLPSSTPPGYWHAVTTWPVRRVASNCPPMPSRAS